MNVPLLSPLPQQYASMSSLDARVFCVPLVSIRLLLLGWSLDLTQVFAIVLFGDEMYSDIGIILNVKRN